MTGGIAADVVLGAGADCPVLAAADEAGSRATEVSWASADDEGIVEEFSMPADSDADAVERIATFDGRSVYRLARDPDRACPCETIERAAGPVSDVRASGGRLHVSFVAADLAELRDAVARLRDTYGGVRVRRLVRADTASDADPVVVDRGRLTDRQREVLRTAHALGYFAHPREANAGAVADAPGVAPATFREHLAAAQRNLLAAVLDA